MSIQKNFDGEMKEYFDTLPKFVQESLMQTDPQITTLPELKNWVEHLMSSNSHCCGD